MPLDPLASVADLSAYLQASPALDANDATAELLLRLASGKVRDYTQQKLNYIADDPAILSPSEWGRAFLPELPIIAGSVVVETTSDNGVTWTPMSAWTLDYATGELSDLSRWPNHAPRGPSSWRVTYSHGYQEIPDGIQAVVLDVAARTMETPIGVELERVGLRQVKYSTAAPLSDDNKADLEPYAVAVLA